MTWFHPADADEIQATRAREAKEHENTMAKRKGADEAQVECRKEQKIESA
jgi:hypothetical protein